jgi:chemotaxis protein MotB
MAGAPDDPSGIVVYPKMKVQQRGSDPGPEVRGFGGGGGGGGVDAKKVIAAIVGAVVIGGAVGYFVRPTYRADAERAKDDLVAAQKSASSEKDRADALDKQLAQLQQDKAAVDVKAADFDKKAAELADAEKKIQGTIDKSQGLVSTEGDEIHLQLVDKVLFATGEDQLTDKGKQVLDKVAAALKDLPDKQVWVQGHTDDQPIIVPPPKKDDPKAKPPAKGKPATPAPEKLPEALRFHTNWELSAARALEVVHYLQDIGKVDPTRLAALAFGQYRPISRSNKALNRRIEIVLYPKREILRKEAVDKPK